jgi:hypothetical protein
MMAPTLAMKMIKESIGLTMMYSNRVGFGRFWNVLEARNQKVRNSPCSSYGEERRSIPRPC